MSDNRATDPDELAESPVLQVVRQSARHAREAAESARKAEAHAISAHEAVGRLSRDLAILRERLTRDESEITLVRDLRKTAHLWRTRFWTVAIAVAGIVAGGGMLHYLHWGP